jgi:Flp pilus assembly protein protease CpaA
MLSLINTTIFVALLVVAAGTDLRTGRIPNKLTGAGLAAALVLLAPSGPPALWAGWPERRWHSPSPFRSSPYARWAGAT